MLENDLLENEDRWQFYDDEETEVMIEITKYVTEIIVYEMAVEFYTMQHNMDAVEAKQLVGSLTFME